MLSGVSEDLPSYLKSNFSALNPHSPQKRAVKNIKPALRQGVSDESPAFFHISHVSVLDNFIRMREIVGNESLNQRFLSNLKQNRISSKPKFDYTDSQSCNFDYHSLTPSRMIDLAANKSPKIRELTKFRQEFDSHLKSGFGKPRGNSTVEAMQPKVPRYRLGQIEILKNRLELSEKKALKVKIPSEKKLILESNFPDLNNSPKPKKLQLRTSTPLDLRRDITEFESRLKPTYSPNEKRLMYNINPS